MLSLRFSRHARVYARSMYTLPTWELATTSPRPSLLLWVNNLYPIKVHQLDFRSVLFKIPITNKLTRMFPPEYNVRSIEKRIKEGGAYVHIEYPQEISAQEAFAEIDTIFRVSPRHFHAATRPARVELVEGKPLLDDFDKKIPSASLRVSFKGSSLSTDDLFRKFRKYGSMVNITLPDTSQAVLDFQRLEGAIAARNCLHNSVFPTKSLAGATSTTLSIDYITIQRMGWLKEQFANHPKIMFPIAAVLAALLTMFLFDPLRVYFIESKMKNTYRYVTHDDSLMVWDAREEEENMIQAHFDLGTGGVTVIAGPKGSGKSVLLDRVLQGRTDVLKIDFSQLEADPDSGFVDKIATAVGYFPNFSFMAQAVGWVEMFVPLTGKSSFSLSAHSQLQNIFGRVEEALKQISATHTKRVKQGKPDIDYDPPMVIFDGLLEFLKNMDDVDEASNLLDVIIHFAVTVAQKKSLARVVIVCNEQPAVESIRRAVLSKGGRRVEVVRIGDIRSQAAASFIKRGLASAKVDISVDDLSFAVSKLGGRISDLESFVVKVSAGVNPNDAVLQMLEGVIIDIRAEGFGHTKGGTKQEKNREKHSQKALHSSNPPLQADAKWTPAQLWKAITLLGKDEYVSYDEMLFNIFNGNITAFNALLDTNLLRVVGATVTAYSPLYRAAFYTMSHDPAMRVGMDIAVARAELEEDTTRLSNIEDELLKLRNLSASGALSRESRAVNKRRQNLEEKMRECIEHLDKIDARLKELTSIQAAD